MLVSIIVFVAVGVAGLVLLGLLTLGLWRQVGALGRQVSDSSSRITAATEALERVAPCRAEEPRSGSVRS